ncbi:hypothetical protein ACFB49_24580 [Sphingomonas sp. DBB INV C78]
MIHGVSGAALILCAGLAATPAQAQALQDRFWLEASAYWPNVDTKIEVSSVQRPDVGTEIDFEQDLDLTDRKTLPAFFAGARLGSNFSVGLEYYSLSRKGEQVIDRDITFDDVTYPVNANVSSKFTTDVYRLTVGYAFLRKENYEFGAALGLHATDFEVKLEGQGSVGGAASSVQARKRDVLAPLPTIGLFGAWEIAPKLTINGRVDYLSLKIDDYDGRLINAQAAISYRFHKNIGAGVMYRYVDYRVDVDKENWQGRVSYEFSGPSIFLQVGF